MMPAASAAAPRATPSAGGGVVFGGLTVHEAAAALWRTRTWCHSARCSLTRDSQHCDSTVGGILPPGWRPRTQCSAPCINAKTASCRGAGGPLSTGRDAFKARGARTSRWRHVTAPGLLSSFSGSTRTTFAVLASGLGSLQSWAACPEPLPPDWAAKTAARVSVATLACTERRRVCMHASVRVPRLFFCVPPSNEFSTPVCFHQSHTDRLY